MKSIPALAAAVLLTFCISCKKEAPGGPAVVTQPATVDTTTITDTEIVTDTVTKKPTGDTSQNALDWPGTYKGITPCGDCPGIETTMVLSKNNTYSLNLAYQERKVKPLHFEGTFSWNDAQNIITLDANGDHHKYKVMEGKLQMLDKFGDPEQGAPAERFILTKEN